MVALRSSCSRISMPTAPWPAHGNMTSGSRMVASSPSGTPSPSSRPSGVMRNFKRVTPASANTVASNSACSASLVIRVRTLPRISVTLRRGFCASNCARRRVLLVATTESGGSCSMRSPALNPRRSDWPGDRSTDGWFVAAPRPESASR